MEPRPLSELDSVDWQSFELPDEIFRDVRIDCVDIPDLLRRTAEGETYNSMMGPELSASLLDYYEYTMHLQFPPVMNEVLPFLLGILQDTPTSLVQGNILRFLAWAFTAAGDTASAEDMTEAFDLDDLEELSEQQKVDFLKTVESAGTVFFTRLPEVMEFTRPFLHSDDPFVRGAAARFFLVTGALLDQSEEELFPLLLGTSDSEALLNYWELYDYSVHLPPSRQAERLLDRLRMRLLQESQSHTLHWDIWRGITEPTPEDLSAIKLNMAEAIQCPEALIPTLKTVYAVMARFHGFESASEHPWTEIMGHSDEETKENIRQESQRVLSKLQSEP